MKTANQTWALLPAIIIITACYLRILTVAFGSSAMSNPASWQEMAPKGARTFLSAHHLVEIFSKFPSSAAMSAFQKYECKAECAWGHSFRTIGRQEGDYPDHILPDLDALVPYPDHILPDHDHFLPYLDQDPHS